MPAIRLENRIQNYSYIEALVAWTGADCGLIGPRFGVQERNNLFLHHMPREHLADFLNDVTGNLGRPRFISEDLEIQFYSLFRDVLSIRYGIYTYTGTLTDGRTSIRPMQYVDHSYGFEKCDCRPRDIAPFGRWSRL